MHSDSIGLRDGKGAMARRHGAQRLMRVQETEREQRGGTVMADTKRLEKKKKEKGKIRTKCMAGHSVPGWGSFCGAKGKGHAAWMVRC